MYYVDTETIGFTGPIVTIQYTHGKGPIHVHHVWLEPRDDTLRLIQNIVKQGICAFNLTYDWWHLTRFYNAICKQTSKYPRPLDLDLDFYPGAKCLKPKHALDLMLIARKGPYQITMDRRPVTIKRVPRECANALADRLRVLTNLDPILFSRAPAGFRQWEIKEIPDPDFVNLRLRFFASGSLKAIIKSIGVKEVDTEGASRAPYAPDIPWQNQLLSHIKYWNEDEKAIRYARNDIDFLRILWRHLGNSEPDDVDSILAVCVASCRYHGYSLDLDRIRTLAETEALVQTALTFNPNSQKECLAKLKRNLPKLQAALVNDTSKDTLAMLKKEGNKDAEEIISARRSDRRSLLYRKLIKTQAFKPDFKVIGARSGRMSGGSIGKRKGSINPQGIQRDNTIRSCFSLTTHDLPNLVGGDFEAFEPCIQAAVYKCKQLEADLRSGTKLYELFTEYMAPDADYHDKKTVTLAWSYMAQPEKIAKVLGIDIEVVEKGLRTFINRYPEVKEARDKINQRFCSMAQPEGLGTLVIWRDPAEYMETMFGFRRYFHVENTITRLLYNVAQDVPRMPSGSCTRSTHKGKQTYAGACQSALYSAAFQLQAANMRAANNHVIQGTGARVCKELQSRLWAIQPIGIAPFEIAPFNVHDEVMAITKPEHIHLTEMIAEGVVHEYKPIIPLIKLTWKTNLKHWGEK